MTSSADVSTLTEALETAREYGACSKVMDSARKKKAELEVVARQVHSRDRSERATDGYSRGASSWEDQFPASAGVSSMATPVSTVGQVDEELCQHYMRSPTRRLDEAEHPSPCQTEIEVSGRFSAPLFDVSQAREPASEPTVTLEVSGARTPGRPTNPLDETNMTPPRGCSMQDEQPAQAPRSSW